MANYRLSQIDLQTRMELGFAMVDPERPWGKVTELSQAYEVSRKWLYELRDKVQGVLLEVLAPQKPGRKPEAKTLIVDGQLVRRGIVTLATAVPGSVRGIKLALELVLNTHRSEGFISETLKGAGQIAQHYNSEVSLPVSVLGEADEIFQGRKPCLTVVDGRSFLVLRLSPEQSRDATTWGTIFLELQEQGVKFRDIASDGARGIRSGVEEAELAIPLRPDLFHLLWEGYKVTRSLEGQAYKAIETADRARRAQEEAKAPKKRRGPRLKVKVPLPQAEEQESQAVNNFDAWEWLFGEIRQALEPFTDKGQLNCVKQAQQTIETAVELLKSLDLPQVTTFAKKLLDRLEELLAPLAWLEQTLAPWREGLDPQTEASIIFAWQHQDDLEVDIQHNFPPHQKNVVQAFWEVLSLFHRSSSLAESLHSWLRPYLQVHRGMPNWLLPLLQIFWNHHTFQRGKRQGKCPLALAGLENIPSLSEVLDMLLNPQNLAQATA